MNQTLPKIIIMTMILALSLMIQPASSRDLHRVKRGIESALKLSRSKRNVADNSLDQVLSRHSSVNCKNYKCAAGSTCSAMEGGVFDTGMPMICRCPPGRYGTFCTFTKDQACAKCGSNRCVVNNIHWSGAYCYNNSWNRILMGNCGRWDFQCDGSKCIKTASLCDGVSDCADKSDETGAQCTRT